MSPVSKGEILPVAIEEDVRASIHSSSVSKASQSGVVLTAVDEASASCERDLTPCATNFFIFYFLFFVLILILSSP